jgi:hypothetical protein
MICRCGANPDGLCGDCWLGVEFSATLEKSSDIFGSSFPEGNANAMPTQCERIKLTVVPCTLADANAFVRKFHRHCKPTQGYRFAIGVVDEAKQLRGVAIVGRPVARHLDDGITGEITRVCTDGTRNACSMLYAAARRAAKAMGMHPLFTYTLVEEGGASLRAAGFRVDQEFAGGSSKSWHSRENRKAIPIGDDLIGGKIRWIA